jgi:hypothetical protein
MSIPAFVFYGLNIKETGISGLTGTDCTVLSEYQNMRTAGVYTGIVILLSTGLGTFFPKDELIDGTSFS